MGAGGLGGAGGGRCLTMTVQPDCQFKLPMLGASSHAWAYVHVFTTSALDGGSLTAFIVFRRDIKTAS